jgi:hypothetical protein
MAIFHNGKEITEVYHGNKAIMAIYSGARLVWETIRSCFGKGYWVNTLPWKNDDTWKNE